MLSKLTACRRQTDTLSTDKLNEVITAYRDYHIHHVIEKDKIVYMTKSELVDLNPKLVKR